MSLLEKVAMGVMKSIEKRHPPLLSITRIYGTEAADFVQKGDVLLYRGAKNDIVAAGICLFTESPYSHAEIYVRDGWSIGALEDGISYDYAVGEGKAVGSSDPAWIDVFRYKGGLTAAQRDALIGDDQAQLGKPYGILPGIIEFPFPRAWEFVPKASYRAFGCSMLVSFCYEKIGLPLATTAAPLQAPADVGHSPQLQYVCSVYGGKLRLDKAQFVNKDDPEVQAGKWNWLAQFIVGRIIDPLSSRTGFYEKLAEAASQTKTGG